MLLFLFLMLACAPLLAQGPSTFKVEASYIKVPVTVFDAEGRIRTDLTRENFRLLDEGEPRPIENFVIDMAPINVILLIDASGSIRDELDELKDAAYQFARSFSKEDRIAVASFADEIHLHQKWTNKLGPIRKSLNELKSGYRTAFYDALLEAANGPLAKTRGRKVIIVLTDGLDNESRAGYADVVENLVKSNTVLYIVSRTRLVRDQIEKNDRVEFLNQVMKNLLSENSDFVDLYFQEKETALSRLAEATGGRVFFPEKLEELAESYVQVARELKSQYLLTFRPPEFSSKAFRQIQVLCTQPISKIYHRTQYSFPR